MGRGGTRQPGDHIQLLGSVSSFQVSPTGFWWAFPQMGVRELKLFSSLRAQKGLGAQFVPHLLPSKWPVQVASLCPQQLLLSLVGSTLPSAQGALVLLHGWMECGLCCERSSCCPLSPGWKALQKDLQLVNDPSSAARARPAPQAPTENTQQSPGGVWVPKSSLPKPWKLFKALSALCETRTPLFLLPSVNGSQLC